MNTNAKMLANLLRLSTWDVSDVQIASDLLMVTVSDPTVETATWDSVSERLAAWHRG